MTREQNNLFHAINEAGLRYTGLLRWELFGRGSDVFRNVKSGESVECARMVPGLEAIPKQRWGGPALYASFDRAAVKNEMQFYSRELREVEVNGHRYLVRGAADAWKIVAQRKLWKFKLNTTLAVVNFDPEDSDFRMYLRLIDSNPAVRAAKDDAHIVCSLEDRVRAPIGPPIKGQSFPDYLVSQAVAAPILVHLKTPIIAPTVRNEVGFAPGEGLNLILPGKPNKPIELLRPVSEIILWAGPNGLRFEGERLVGTSAFDSCIREGHVIEFGSNRADVQDADA